MPKEQLPIAGDYLDSLNKITEGQERGWKASMIREYCEVMGKVTGHPVNPETARPHLTRVLNSSPGCSLQTFLVLAWVLGYKVELTPRGEIKQLKN